MEREHLSRDGNVTFCAKQVLELASCGSRGMLHQGISAHHAKGGVISADSIRRILVPAE